MIKYYINRQRYNIQSKSTSLIIFSCRHTQGTTVLRNHSDDLKDKGLHDFQRITILHVTIMHIQ